MAVLGFLIGLAVGGLVGVTIMALMNMASKEDQKMRDFREEYDV